MQKAELLLLEISKEERAEHLINWLCWFWRLIVKEWYPKNCQRLGGLQTRQAIKFLEQKDYYKAALLTLTYCDKYYLKRTSKKI